MAAKSILVICATACLVESIYSQCIGAVNNVVGTAIAAEELALAGNAFAGNALAYGALPGYNYATNAIAPSRGGAFAVTSISPIAPTGISVISENAIEGALAVNGQLPFLGAIALEGALPTAGAGGINYGCGSGPVGILNENIAPAVGPYPGVGYASLGGGIGYGPGVGGVGFNGRPGLGVAGCSAVY